MRFAVDAHAIGRHLTGNEVYIRSLLRGFADLDQESDFVTYLSVMQAEASMPARFSVRRVAANPFLRLGCDLAQQLRRDRPDLIHVQYTAPLACPVPVVVTVHDVSFLERPDYFQLTRAAQLRWSVKRTVQRAARILTVSEFSRSAIARAYGLDEGNIVVVPNAAAEGFVPVNRAAAANKVHGAFGLTAPFIFSVGDLQPRKNHIGMIAAFRDLIREIPNLPHTLVIAGKETWFSPRVHEAARQSGVADRIRFLGYVSDDDLLQLYNACELFCFPSYYEGFGLPVVEAMACGRAVVCSNTSAVPEVADGAALLFDPYQPREIARAMADIIRNPELRTRQERLSLQRATHFSWRQSARKTLDVYYEVAERTQARAKSVQAVTLLR
ncbi:MAG: glycosyltransferase family 4 protein [Candidatus Solibacter usitatus]|nr:glycosyltransferase family 4 protein [Candidatus Solibacter usitatus]